MHDLRAKNPDIPVSGRQTIFKAISVMNFKFVRTLVNRFPQNVFSGLFSTIVAEWKTLPEEKKAKYIAQSDKMKADYHKVKYRTILKYRTP